MTATSDRKTLTERIESWVDSVQVALKAHSTRASILASIACAVMILVLAWFLLLSGLNEPVQFIYANF